MVAVTAVVPVARICDCVRKGAVGTAKDDALAPKNATGRPASTGEARGTVADVEPTEVAVLSGAIPATGAVVLTPL